MTSTNKPQILNERAAQLLKKLVLSYISDGQPVGSKKLAHDTGLDISPATIRNVMSRLEQQGLVTAPHTSAGRIPTEEGFRFFVDSLLEVTPIKRQLVNQMKKQLNSDKGTDNLLSNAGQMVSQLTQMAGIITIPRPNQSALRHIEFLPLSDNRVLAIMVINEKEVQNRVLHLEREYSADELRVAASFINQNFAGKDVFEIRQSLLLELEKARERMDDIMQSAVEVATRALDSDDNEQQNPYVVKGESNLLRHNADSQQLQQLLEMFNHKRKMLSLLDRCIQSEGVKVFIGNEIGVEGLGDCSVITAPYSVDGQILGVLGVIGPTRIKYDQVVPVVDITARILSEALRY
jgi:heat-inducible transcriptional repressor